MGHVEDQGLGAVHPLSGPSVVSAVPRIVENQGVADDQQIRTLIQQELGRSAMQILVKQLQGGPHPTFTTATRPAATSKNAGTIIFVSDGAAGSKFQGSDGSSWLGLG